MHFTVSEKVQILFEGWKTTSLATMACSVLVVFLLSILYEFLKAYRMYKPVSKNSPETAPLLTRNSNQIGLGQMTHSKRFNLRQHAENTFFFLLNFVFAYFLMLVAMTYNVWLFLAIIVGYGVGYFVAQPLCEHYLSDVRPHQETTSSYGAISRSGNVVL